MSTVVLIEFHPVEGRADAIRDGLVRALNASTDEHLLGGQVLVEDGPGTVIAVQTWTSAEDFRTHMEQAGGFDSMHPVLAEPPHVRFLTQHTSR